MPYISLTVVPCVPSLSIYSLYFKLQHQVWPSFWTLGTETTWPGSGEIDIIEAINDMTFNQVALHTPVGCYQANVTTQSGTTDEIDCSTNQGCLVQENKPNSYGPAFAAAGGGVFALQLDVSGISVWFFSVCRTFLVWPWFHTTLATQRPRNHHTSNHNL
jgi:hypothetical protein